MSASDPGRRGPAQHDAEHEERLALLLAGERDAADPAAARWLAECATCRERWDALRGASARMAGAADDQRGLLSRLAETSAAPGEERVAATLARLAAERAPERPARALAPAAPRVTRWPLAAAALVLLIGWIAVRWLERGAPAPEPGPGWLGEGRLELVAPRDEVAGFERFEWTYDRSESRFDLRIYDERAGESGAPLVEIRRWKDKTWTPTAEERQKLGGRIVWIVDALDEFGSVRASARASAWLSSR